MSIDPSVGSETIIILNNIVAIIYLYIDIQIPACGLEMHLCLNVICQLGLHNFVYVAYFIFKTFNLAV